MAWRWRIRHKLMLGLGLVIGILALLLTGTLKGLAAYRATINSIDSKLIELVAAHEFRNRVRDLFDPPAGAGDPRSLPDDDKDAREAVELRRKMALARTKLNDYQERLRETLTKRRDPDKGFREQNLIDSINERFDRLDRAIDQRLHAASAAPNAGSSTLIDDDRVKAALKELMVAADQLPDDIYWVVYNIIFRDAKGNYRLTTALVVAISVLAVLLMITLLRAFYRWTFHPLRDLQEGAGRIAQGDFDHVIAVTSGDEMQELADAFNDMTRRLRDMYADLARQVNERSRQLVRSERLAGVGFLAAGVAHEINNPLASIAFCSEALDGRLTELLGREARASGMSLQLRAADPDDDRAIIFKYLKMIQDEAFRCKEITEKLLEFSRSGERSREPANLADIIQSVMDVVQHIPSSKGKKIDFPGGKVVAWVNAQEIKPVVLNLVVNALESMDDGGALKIRLSQHDGLAEMVFSDTGCGMTPAVLENIFEPFFTTKSTGKGTGLGLSISHRVISQHGGEIEATSEGPGKGSTFTVRIPLHPPAPAEEREHETQRAA